jgi:predicted dehydrogenase
VQKDTPTLVRPSEQLKRGKLDLDGVDLGQPTAVREHLFGKVLRVDKVEPEPLDSLTLELLDFVSAARGISRPRVSGEDALRAVRLADQVLRSLETHRWNGDSPALPAESASVLRGPHVWRTKTRQNSGHVGH